MASFLRWLAAIIVPALVASAFVASPVAVASPRAASIDVAVTSATTLMVDGTYAFGVEGKMDDKLQGDLCRPPYDCTEVEYNNWVFAPVSAGTRALGQAIASVDGNMVSFCYSRGAMACHEWIDENANNPFVPSAEELKFVFIGNPYRKYGGTMADKGQQLSTGAYHVLDIATEYDSVADVPDKRRGTWFARLLARSNAKLSQHLAYDEVDLTRSDLLVYVEQNPGGGTTTYVLVPTKNLPLLDGLRSIFPKWADSLQERWKPMIDSTFDRSMYTPAGPGGVQLPFSDEESTTVEMTTDESVSTFSSSPARTARQNVAPESESEPEQPVESVVEETELSSNDSDQTNTPAKREVEPEPEIELDPEMEADQEPVPSNKTEEESEPEPDLEAKLDDEMSNERPDEPNKNSGTQSLKRSGDDDNDNDDASPDKGNDDSSESSDSSNDD